MARTLKVLGCLLLILVPAAASFAAEEPAALVTLEIAVPHEAGQGDFAAWLAQQELAATPLQPEPKAGCTIQFCSRCEDVCCPTTAGGCKCCSPG